MSSVILLWLQVSEQAGHIIQYDKFYIHELDDLIDIRNDYVTWIQKQMYQSVSWPFDVCSTPPFVTRVYAFVCGTNCVCLCILRVMMVW